MNITIIIILSLFLVGCHHTTDLTSSKNNNNSDYLTVVNHEMQILTYYVDPVYQFQKLAIVGGKFLFENGCIYLVNNNEKRISFFPELPENSAQWDIGSQSLLLTSPSGMQYYFKNGDNIITNGYYGSHVESDYANFSVEQRKCLTNTIGTAVIGTIDIEKLN